MKCLNVATAIAFLLALQVTAVFAQDGVQQPGSIQASAPEPPRAPLVLAFRTTPEIANVGTPAIASSLLLKTNYIRTPHLQSNPPLLI